MGRYHPSVHDSFIKCDQPRCGARNAPEESEEYDTECWRCGEPLDGKPQPGDEIVVDIVDEQDDGCAIGKTEGGFVLFLDEELAALESTVRVTEVDETHGRATVIGENKSTNLQ